MSTITYYEVRFHLYQYNSGAADNGIYNCSETFQTQDDAQAFLEQLESWIVQLDNHQSIQDTKYQELLDKHIWSGYLVRTYGLYRIQHTRIG